MKTLSLLIATLSVVLAFRATAQDTTEYRVLKICESDYVLHTTDGADAGRIEYIVVDPGQDRIVSAIVTGGVVADRFVTLPFSVFELGTSRDVVLREVDRTRLIGAPVIERSRITTTRTFDRGLVERSYTHFGLDVHSTTWQGRDRDRSSTRGTSQVDSPPRTNRGFSTSETTRESDRRRPGEPDRKADATRQPDSTNKNTATSEAKGKDKNATAGDRDEKSRTQRRDADATADKKPNAASTAKEDALKEKEKNDRADKENAPPQKRDATGKENTPPEKARGNRGAEESATHRNPEGRAEEKKNPDQPGKASQKPDAAAGSKAREEQEHKGTPGAPARGEQPSPGKPAEAKDKEKEQSPQARQNPTQRTPPNGASKRRGRRLMKSRPSASRNLEIELALVVMQNRLAIPSDDGIAFCNGRLGIMEQSIRISVEHHFGRAEASRRLRDWIDRIQLGSLPAGVKLSDIFECWAGNVLEFSLRLHKRFLSATVAGVVTIHDREVVLDLNVPEMVHAFISRSTIHESLEASLREALNSPANDSALCN